MCPQLAIIQSFARNSCEIVQVSRVHDSANTQSDAGKRLHEYSLVSLKFRLQSGELETRFVTELQMWELINSLVTDWFSCIANYY